MYSQAGLMYGYRGVPGIPIPVQRYGAGRRPPARSHAPLTRVAAPLCCARTHSYLASQAQGLNGYAAAYAMQAGSAAGLPHGHGPPPPLVPLPQQPPQPQQHVATETQPVDEEAAASTSAPRTAKKRAAGRGAGPST